MGADDDIHLTISEILEEGCGLLGRAGTREIIHTHGHILKARGEGAEVLISQYGGRHEHSHLLAIGGSLEGSSHSHLGLTKAHIATHQTVHRLGLLHIGLHILCGLQLIGGILIEERGLKLMLQIGVVAEGKALLATTLGVEFEEVASDVLDMFLGALLEFLPLTCAQRGETRRLAIILRLVLGHLI